MDLARVVNDLISLTEPLLFAFLLTLAMTVFRGRAADWLRFHSGRPYRRFLRGRRVAHPPDAIGEPEVRGVAP